MSFIQMQWSQEVTLFPMIETSQLMVLQARLALLQPLRPHTADGADTTPPATPQPTPKRQRTRKAASVA